MLTGDAQKYFNKFLYGKVSFRNLMSAMYQARCEKQFVLKIIKTSCPFSP